MILADTVGFIRDLPHHLIEAFKATLEETKEADLLLHVIDSSDPNWADRVSIVMRVLKKMGIDSHKIIQVFNKIDLQDGWPAKIEDDDERCTVWVSSVTGAGLDLLRDAIVSQLFGEAVEASIVLQPQEAKLRAQLYALGAVVDEVLLDEGGWRLTVRLNADEQQRLFPTVKGAL